MSLLKETIKSKGNISTEANSGKEINISPKSNKENDFNNKENLEKYMKVNYPSFFETFELSEYINCGSVGQVFKGIYKVIKREVVIKMIKNRYNKYSKEKIKSRIEEEMNISTKLHNMNIMETYAYIKINENYNFCALEYGKNGDLEYLIRHFLKRIII